MSLRPALARGLLGASLAGAVFLSACAAPFSPAPAKVYRVGWLSGSSEAQSTLTDALRQALRELGYVEGRNLVLEARYGEGRADRYTAIAAEFVALKLDVIVVKTTAGALAVKQATSTIPIVLAGVPNPVENGLVASLARPGGNITGTAGAGTDVVQRRLQLFKEAFPLISRVAYLFDASAATGVRGYEAARSAAAALGVEVLPFEMNAPEDVADALAAAGRAHPDAIYAGTGPLMAGNRLVDFLAASRLPSMTSGNRSSVDGGALMYYGANDAEFLGRAMGYVDRILKGANPAEMPIEKPSKFDLIINLRTAKALGLTIPPSVLAQATEVIQ